MDQNEVLFDRAQKSIPGGVNSPVRAFRSESADRFPLHGAAARIWP